MSWVTVAIASSIAGAGASIYGARKNADAIEAGSDQAAAVQREALRTNVALSRPQLEVGTGALGILASLYGIAPPTPIDFDNLGGGSGQGRGDISNNRGLDGLAAIPGATWQGRPVFTDESGGIYAPTGRDASVDGGVTYLGQASEGNMRFKGPGGNSRRFIRTSTGGMLDYRDGQFFDHRGPRANPIEIGPFQQAPEPDAAAGGAPGAGLNLNDLVANNPLIRFNREQGEQAIARGAAARGLNQSGGTLRDLSRFNQDLAGAGVQNFVLNPLFELAGFGPRAAAQIGGAATTTSTNLGNLAMGAANARGSAYQNAGNTIGNLAGGFADYAMYRNYMGGLGGNPVGSGSGGGGTINTYPGSPFFRGGNN